MTNGAAWVSNIDVPMQSGIHDFAELYPHMNPADVFTIQGRSVEMHLDAASPHQPAPRTAARVGLDMQGHRES
jgi:hypothetical protein